MDYNKYFSADVPSFLRSPVREIFRKVDLSAICSFAGGYPAAVTFPVEDIKRLSGEVLEKYGTKALQYGATQGVPELREVIAKRYGVPVSQVQITTSSQQGIDVCTRVFVNPGDIVLANNPVYLGALQSFRAYRAQVKSINDYNYRGTDTPSENQVPPIASDGFPLMCRGRRQFSEATAFQKKSPQHLLMSGALEKPRRITLPTGRSVPSSRVSLTSLFGMGRGGSSPL